MKCWCHATAITVRAAYGDAYDDLVPAQRLWRPDDLRGPEEREPDSVRPLREARVWRVWCLLDALAAVARTSPYRLRLYLQPTLQVGRYLQLVERHAMGVEGRESDIIECHVLPNLRS